jgi:hypothetical protein
MENSVRVIERAPEACDQFMTYPLGGRIDQEARRQEARMLLTSLLARHILTQVRRKDEARKAA